MVDFRMLEVKPEFVVELAMNVEDPCKVARKHGYSDEEYFKFCTYPWFNKAVGEKREELEKAGFDFKGKMRMLAEDMIIDAYLAAKKSDAVTPKLDVAKHLTKIAGLEPNPAAQPNQANANFSITITLPKPYLDSLHDKNTPNQITLRQDNVEDATVLTSSVEDIAGSPPELSIAPAVNNKDLA